MLERLAPYRTFSSAGRTLTQICGRYCTGIKLRKIVSLVDLKGKLNRTFRGLCKTYRLQKKYSKYIQIGMDGRKNCLVAGIKHTNSETSGMTTLTAIGIGAITREKIMKKAKAGY